MSDWTCYCDHCLGITEPPEPCEFCSRWNDTTQEHDGTCDNITREQWIERFGKDE